VASSAWRRPIIAWREVSPFLGASAARLALLVGLSLAKAVSEAFVLVLVARVALALSEGDDALEFSGPVIGDVRLETGHAVLVALTAGVVMLIMSIAIARVTAGMAADGVSTARTRLLNAFAAATWDLQARERTGHLQELLTSYVQRISTGMIVVSGSLTAALSLLALLVTALIAYAIAAIAMLVAVVGLTLLLRPLSRITRRNSRLQAQVNAKFAADVTETVSITQEVRVFGVTGAVGDRMRGSVDACRTSLFEVLKMRRLVVGLYQSAAILLILVGLGAVVVAGPSNVSGLAVVVLLFIRAVSYGQQLQTAIQQANELLPFLQELRRQEAIYERAKQPVTGEPIDHVGDLAFEQVSYASARPSRRSPILSVPSTGARPSASSVRRAAASPRSCSCSSACAARRPAPTGSTADRSRTTASTRGTSASPSSRNERSCSKERSPTTSPSSATSTATR
jgi:ABC-type multidrug transport system fused ATPase/permease subunit